MGLKRRITLGFMGIVSILLISGMVSFIELSLLGRETDKIFESTRRNSDFAGEMIRNLSSQNSTFVKMLAFEDNTLDSICYRSFDQLGEVLNRAHTHSATSEHIDSMSMRSQQMRNICSNFIAARDSLNKLAEARRIIQLVDSSQSDSTATHTVEARVSDEELSATTISIYDQYQSHYNSMMEMVNLYLSLSQDALNPDAQRLHHNAYRAVTPVMISLFVMIIVVLMLYYFTMIICVNPIIAINNSLKNFMSYKISFAPKCYRRDEAEELCEGINKLIKESKKGENQ